MEKRVWHTGGRARGTKPFFSSSPVLGFLEATVRSFINFLPGWVVSWHGLVYPAVDRVTHTHTHAGAYTAHIQMTQETQQAPSSWAPRTPMPMQRTRRDRGLSPERGEGGGRSSVCEGDGANLFPGRKRRRPTFFPPRPARNLTEVRRESGNAEMHKLGSVEFLFGEFYPAAGGRGPSRAVRGGSSSSSAPLMMLNHPSFPNCMD